MFKTMLYGAFSEALKDPDDPIALKDVDPKIFDKAMRFYIQIYHFSVYKCVSTSRYVYGNEMNFVGIEMKIYELADMLQILPLQNAVEQQLSVVTEHNVLVALNFGLKYNKDEDTLDSCRAVSYDILC